MAEREDPAGPESSGDLKSAVESERLTPLVTRRDFIVGAGAGAVAVGVVAGAGVAVTRSGQPVGVPQPAVQVPGAPAVAVAPAPAAAKPQAAAAGTQALPATMRRVTLEIDGVKHDVTVETRESLWETMTRKLNMASSNLGCDRAQCGACAVLVDGRSMNSCTILSVRLGRGQQITTVAGLSKGPGVEGLHPIQRAFWQEGGFQCGICTRGFIMSSYALLQANPKPTDDEIAEALSGNICRCGEYPKIFPSVRNAAAEMRGEKVTWTAPVISVRPATPAPASGAPAQVTSKDFELVAPLATIEEVEPLARTLKTKDGIVEVGGSERTLTIKWDPTKTDEAAVRQALAATGHPAK